MSELPTSATALRNAYRAAGLSERHLQCLQHCVALIQAPEERCEQQLLEVIAEHYGVPHAVLLGYQAGRLRALAALGGAAIIASRQPVIASLAPLLKWPCRHLIRNAPDKAWLFYAQAPGFEWLVPVALEGKVVGVLALAGYADQPVPGDRDQQLMSVLSALLSAQTGNPGPRAGRRIRAHSEELALLSPREKEVMSLLPRGMTNARIAATLGIAPGTVKTHVERILYKLRLRDRSHAAARAVELKLGDSGI